MFKNDPDILTVTDVIRLLRIGKNTVYSLIKGGSIAGIKQVKEALMRERTRQEEMGCGIGLIKDKSRNP